MKTVKDAVKLYQGHFPDGPCGCYGGWELEFDKLFHNCLFICTRKEFEDCAKMMKLNKEAVSSSDNESKSDTPIYSQQKSVLMEESLRCIIDYLKHVGVGGVNQNYQLCCDIRF